MPIKPTSVSEYIASAPTWAQGILKDMRKVIKEAAPKAEESLSYHMPYYSQKGRVAYFSAHKNHCSFFWINSEDKKLFAKELATKNVKGSTLHIPKNTKVPVGIIKKLVKVHVKRNEEKAKTKDKAKK